MRWLRFLSCAICAAGFLSVAAYAPAQDADAGKEVQFVTADKVHLKGRWFAGKDGKAATVLMLHALGEDGSKADWLALAKELNKRGYAVLTFDFRGHGDSTKVDPGMPNFKNPALSVKGFWDQADNAKSYKGYSPNQPRKDEIEFKSFTPAYHRILVNDITAAKAFIDDRNDAGECNSNALIILGAKDGGTLGAIWMNSEWHRFKWMQTNPVNPNIGVADVQNPEGQAIVGAVFLSLSENLGANRVNVAGILTVPAKTKSTPICFFYGEQDEKSKKVALACEKILKDKKNTFLGKAGVPKTDVAGRLLLSPTLGTTAAITDYLDNALENKTFKAKKSQKEEASIWQWQSAAGGVGKFMARPKNAGVISFFTYDPFIRYAQ